MATYHEIYIFRIACDPVAIFHSGFGKLRIPADFIIGPADVIATGAGQLINLPDFEQLINGTAERIEYQMSGVSEDVARLALDDAPSVAGADVDVGRMDCDENWQQIAPVEWESHATAQSLNVNRGATEGMDTPNRRISLTVTAGDATRARAPQAFFTDADQRRRSSDDAIFDHVAGISAGTSRRFGPSDA